MTRTILAFDAAALLWLALALWANGHPAPKVPVPEGLFGEWSMTWRDGRYEAYFDASGNYSWRVPYADGTASLWRQGCWELVGSSLRVWECGRWYEWRVKPTATGWAGEVCARPTEGDTEPQPFGVELKAR